MKLPNDLIKATDYDKAKDRIIKEFECVNDKIVQHYALGGEHELTTQEIIDCLNALSTIDCDLQTAYAYIKGQKEQIADLEAKLAEKEKTIENWQTMYQSVMQSCYNSIEEDKRLREQLAEKKKEIKEVKKWWAYQYEGNAERKYQDKISFCIEKLEKVKELIKNMSIGIGIEIYGTRIKPIEEEIDNQIKVIKEMK